MSRDSYRQGVDDAQKNGEPNRRLYLIDSSYAEGFDGYMEEHPMGKGMGKGIVKVIATIIFDSGALLDISGTNVEAVVNRMQNLTEEDEKGGSVNIE